MLEEEHLKAININVLTPINCVDFRHDFCEILILGGLSSCLRVSPRLRFLFDFSALYVDDKRSLALRFCWFALI